MSNIANIKTYDIANGRGIRTSIFFSGCEHKCKNCFNQSAWDFNVGVEFNREYYETIIKPTINEHIDGISILGGEPMHPRNIGSTYLLCTWFKEDFPTKNIWLWSGYTYGELVSEEYELTLDVLDYIDGLNIEIFKLIDVFVDGRFIETEKDLTLKWRGSRNQRVIDMPETLRQNKITLLEE